MPRRGQHFLDTPLGDGQRRRSLRNWCNYQSPAGMWLPTDQAIEDAPGTPNDWEGPDFHFTKNIARGPLQLYFGDTADPDNTTMIGARLSHAPGKWLQVQAQNVTPGVPMQVVAVEKQVRWVDLWPKSTLVYQATPNGFRKYIHLREGHPTSFTLAVRVPAGASIVPAGGGAKILDAQGQVHLRIPAPWGMDSSQGDPRNGMGQPVRVAFEWGAAFTEPSGDQVQVFRFVPNQDDLASAVYPVLLDPTVVISGTTDIEDNHLVLPFPTENCGGYAFAILRGGEFRKEIIRLQPSSIPAGDITGFRLFLFGALVTAPNNCTAYFVADANDWVEGTSTFADEPGACCWNQPKYLEQDWAGHPILGCGKSGVDFDADPTPPAINMQTGVWNAWTLKSEWPPLWRDAIRAPNGIICKESLVIGDPNVVTYATENVTGPLYFEIDYKPVAGAFFLIGF